MRRRTLLGTTGALGVEVALGGYASAMADHRADHRSEAADARITAPARAALLRLLPKAQAEQFRLTALAGPERFAVSGRTGEVEVAGTSPAVLLTGVHWYLKYTCLAQVSWAGSRLRLPDRLPAPQQPEERAAGVAHRFVLNDTQDGYTAPYADWPHWERLIDVLALHGCNEVLVTPGAEAVHHRVLTEFGYSDAEARAWLPAPSHQPWWLLQNMSGWGGPVSERLLATRTALARRIVSRLRELGMAPVLPGCFGTVPADFSDRNPGARTVPQGTWAGMRRPDWLDPRTAAFRRLAAAFYRHQRELFGEAALVKMDLLHEGGDPGGVPVPEAARAVEQALRSALPEAVWVMLGWQRNPRRELLDALAEPGRVLIVDGLSDLDRTTDRERDWGSVPYAFGTIPNFGGRTTLGARTQVWAERFAAWRDAPGSTLVGTAYLAEATGRDPAAFELFSELAWRHRPVDRDRWFERYAEVRYGGRDPAARRALAALKDSAYRLDSSDGRPHDSVFAARPSLDARSGTTYATRELAYDPAVFDTAFAALLQVRPRLRDSDTYRYDLTDAARQALAHRSRRLIGQLQQAHRRRDLSAFRALAELWLTLMRLSDEVAGAHHSFLLGPWLDQARRAAGDRAEADRLECTARTLITTWAGRAAADTGRLADYANRDWHGLIGDFYLPRWRRYLEEMADALAEDREPADIDWYTVELPWTRDHGSYPLRPVGDAHRIARQVHRVLAAAPFQGELALTARPSALTPGGGDGVLTAVFRNVNGLRETGPVELALTGFADAEPQGPTALPQVAPGGTGAVRWRVPAPQGPPTVPLRPLPYQVTAVYGPKGEQPVAAVHDGTLFVAGELAAGLATANGNDAVFGQAGARWAIHGGGRDLWRARQEFGAIYRPGALAEGAAVTVRVLSQEATGPWARAGIAVRNSLATAGSPGFVTLTVTPRHGVVLAYDANGDGSLDRLRQVAGVRAPVLLRLQRTTGSDAGAAGRSEFTGRLSLDGGGHWRTVGTVRVPAAAQAQDAGLVMSAAHGGTGARGTAEFDRWRTG